MNISRSFSTSLLFLVPALSLALIAMIWSWQENLYAPRTMRIASNTSVPENLVPDRYIVVLYSSEYITFDKARLMLKAKRHTLLSGFIPNPEVHGTSANAWNFDTVGHTFTAAIKGFSARLSPAAAAALAKDSAVRYLSPVHKLTFPSRPQVSQNKGETSIEATPNMVLQRDALSFAFPGCRQAIRNSTAPEHCC